MNCSLYSNYHGMLSKQEMRGRAMRLNAAFPVAVRPATMQTGSTRSEDAESVARSLGLHLRQHPLSPQDNKTSCVWPAKKRASKRPPNYRKSGRYGLEGPDDR